MMHANQVTSSNTPAFVYPVHNSLATRLQGKETTHHTGDLSPLLRRSQLKQTGLQGKASKSPSKERYQAQQNQDRVSQLELSQSGGETQNESDQMSGIGQESILKGIYFPIMNQLESDWATLNEGERYVRIFGAILTILEAAGIPPITNLHVNNGANGVVGVFSPQSWEISIFEKYFTENLPRTQENLDINDISAMQKQTHLRWEGLVGVLYHEIRHAQQHYDVLRWQMNAPEEERLTDVNFTERYLGEVLDLAANDAFIPDNADDQRRRLEAEVWASTIYTTENEERTQAVRYKRDALTVARQEQEKLLLAIRFGQVDPQDEDALRQEAMEKEAMAEAEYNEATSAYFSLLEEADAYRLQELAVEKYLEQYPIAP